jgi:hypothetical protein
MSRPGRELLSGRGSTLRQSQGGRLRTHRESITDFKAAIDAELGEERLARLDRWKRVKLMGDCCVEDVYRIRMTRQHAEREGFPDEYEKLLRIEQELMQMTQRLRKEAKKLSQRPK